MPITTILLPKTLHRWEFATASVKEGASINQGDPIASFERKDKVEVLRSTASGVLLRLLVTERLECEAGDPIALVGQAGDVVGYDANQIRCVRMELLNKCSDCSEDYPLNGLVEEARCTRCGETQMLGASFWEEELVEDVNFARKPGRRGGGECLGGPSIECRGVPPFCRKCSALIPAAALDQARREISARGQQAATATAIVTCNQCSEPHTTRLAPSFAREVFKGLVLLFGETTAEASAAVSTTATTFQCPTCTAAVPLAGDKRVVRCQYCNSDVRLPDDLFLTIKKSAKKAQWWMLLEP